MTSSPTNLGDLWKICTGLQEWAAVLCHKKLHPIISEALIMTHGWKFLCSFDFETWPVPNPDGKTSLVLKPHDIRIKSTYPKNQSS